MPSPEDDPKMHRVKTGDPDDGFAWKHEGDITEEDEPFEEATPSEKLKEVLSTRQANALADAGITTVDEALSYDGDLTELDGVGDGTVEDLLDAAEA